MFEAPRVTFCTPSFNRGSLVADTLVSLLGQTDPRWEAIVVDDGSTDNSLAVIEAYTRRDPRIRLVGRERGPKGASTCRNIGVEQARGRYVMFLDTDDLVAPFCVAQRVAALEADPCLDFAVFPMLLFRGRPEDAHALWNVETDTSDLLRVLYLDPVCQGTGTLWRRESFVRTGMWDEGLAIWQDIELHVRAFSGGYRYVRRFDLPPDTFIRETPNSLSRGGYHTRVKVESRAEVVRRAVAVLRETGQVALIPEVRFLTADVVQAAISGNHLDLAHQVLEWAGDEGVFGPDDVRLFRRGLRMRQFKLDRLSLLRRRYEHALAAYRRPTTVGAMPPSALLAPAGQHALA